MNKQQTKLFASMTKEEQQQVNQLENQLAELLKFHKKVNPLWMQYKEIVGILSILSFIFITVFNNLGIIITIIGALIFIPVYFVVVINPKISERRKNYFTENIKNYAPRARNIQAIDDLKKQVQIHNNLYQDDIDAWFHSEMLNIKKQINHLYSKHEYAWFHQNSDFVNKKEVEKGQINE